MISSSRQYNVYLLVGLLFIVLVWLYRSDYVSSWHPDVSEYMRNTGCLKSDYPPSPEIDVANLDHDAWKTWLSENCDDPEPLMDRQGYGTHGFVLLAALYLTTGPVLELGTGDFSTNLADKLSLESGRYVLSADNEKSWLKKLMTKSTGSCHDFFYVKITDDGEWGKVGASTRWSVAFVDQRPAVRRHLDVKRLLGNSEIVLAHDSEASSNHMYLYKNITATTKYTYRWEYHITQTTVFSATRPDLVEGVKKLLKWVEQDFG